MYIIVPVGIVSLCEVGARTEPTEIVFFLTGVEYMKIIIVQEGHALSLL